MRGPWLGNAASLTFFPGRRAAQEARPLSPSVAPPLLAHAAFLEASLTHALWILAGQRGVSDIFSWLARRTGSPPAVAVRGPSPRAHAASPRPCGRWGLSDARVADPGDWLRGSRHARQRWRASAVVRRRVPTVSSAIVKMAIVARAPRHPRFWLKRVGGGQDQHPPRSGQALLLDLRCGCGLAIGAVQLPQSAANCSLDPRVVRSQRHTFVTGLSRVR